MHIRVVITAAWLLARQAVAQGIGNSDTHPQLTTERCTKAGGCVRQNTSIVLDASFHPLRQVDGTSSCGGYDGALNKELCPDHEACAKNCVFDGADYEGNGVLADGNILTLNMYGERDGKLATLSPRVYLLDAKEDDYEILHLKNQEISFDVDVSKLTGARSALNPAGAKYGTGYCDAQCPNLPFINGVVSFTAPSILPTYLEADRISINPGQYRLPRGLLQRDGPLGSQLAGLGIHSSRMQPAGRVRVQRGSVRHSGRLRQVRMRV